MNATAALLSIMSLGLTQPGAVKRGLGNSGGSKVNVKPSGYFKSAL